MLSLSDTIHEINSSTYKLDTSGVAGLFGGDAAVDALTTIHLFAGRRFSGWYNYPGTHAVAMRFGQMAKTPWWDSLFPGPNETPALTFRLAGESGPSYNGSFSGTKLQKTHYLGHLTAQGSADCHSHQLKLVNKAGGEGRNTGNAAVVTIVSLPPKRHGRMSQNPTPASVSATKPKPKQSILITPKFNLLPFLAVAPSLISIVAVCFCLLGKDLICASLILFGMVNSGISSLVLGSAKLSIRAPVPSLASPPGDGLMFPEGGGIIVLKGEEADVNIVTKGEFELDYSTGILFHPDYHLIGFSSFLLLAQSLLQLLLISLCTFFGQLMFLASLVVSGSYHLYVVSYQRQRIHRELLFQELSPRMEKWSLGTRTQMAVFVCLCVGENHEHPLKVDYNAIMHSIIPNETPVWKCWRKKVLKELERSGVHSRTPTFQLFNPNPKMTRARMKRMNIRISKGRIRSSSKTSSATRGVFSTSIQAGAIVSRRSGGNQGSLLERRLTYFNNPESAPSSERNPFLFLLMYGISRDVLGFRRLSSIP